jgi:nicotinamidase-related amidase
MRDCLLLVDVFNDFRHDDGARLLESFKARFSTLLQLLEYSRAEETPVIYANDSGDVFDGHAGAIVERALSGPGAAAMAAIQPVGGDRFVVKPRYSAFDYTPLGLILEELAVERIVLAGMSTEGCVAQTAIAAKERGYKVTVVPRACATIDTELEEIALAYLSRVVGVRVDADFAIDCERGSSID